MGSSCFESSSHVLRGGSIPLPSSHGPVAPTEEQLPCKEKVVGSNPTWSTGDWCQRFNTSAFQAEALGSNPRSPTKPSWSSLA